VSVYIFTGKLGGGKTLCSVGRIEEKLKAGCRIATNLDLNLVKLLGMDARDCEVLRVPDKPKIEDMEYIGVGNTEYDETLNGLLVLDECGTWFNSRNWNDKDRKPVNDWFLHARKLGWDVILIIQDIKLLDSQARNALAEHTVFCKRLDRIQVPLVGSLWKMLTGYRLTGPKVHVAKCVYGISEDDLVSDRWVYRGHNLYPAYDTKQLFLADYQNGVHSVLTPWHIRGRYKVKRDRKFYMRLTKIYWKRFSTPLAMGAGAFGGAAFAVMLGMYAISQDATADQEKPLQALAHKIVDQEEVPAPQPEREDHLFDGYRIASYIQSDNKTQVTLQSPGGLYMTSDQVEALDYRLLVISNCEVDVRHQVNWSDHHKIITPYCTPKPHNRPAYDLAQLPIGGVNHF